MRFLADQDVYATTVRFLTGLGHDVVPLVGSAVRTIRPEHSVRTADPTRFGGRHSIDNRLIQHVYNRICRRCRR